MFATAVDPRVAHTFLRVLNMLDKPFMLQRPDVMVPVIRGARRARRRPTPTGTHSPLVAWAGAAVTFGDRP